MDGMVNKMSDRGQLCAFNYFEYHKGFYNDEEPTKALLKINYTDFWDFPDDEEFTYYTAYELLCGSCNHFAVSLNKIFGYNLYIIEGKNKRGFHAFCQIYTNRTWYYVDARGITSSFDEFMDVAKIFVTDEYIIRPVTSDDINEWEMDSKYNEQAYAFSEAVIEKFKECYML